MVKSITISFKIKHPVHIILTYVMNEFSTADCSCTIQQNIFGITLTEVCSPHLYVSFGTFCVQIGQLFEALWSIFENRQIIAIEENVFDYGFLPNS